MRFVLTLTLVVLLLYPVAGVAEIELPADYVEDTGPHGTVSPADDYLESPAMADSKAPSFAWAVLEAMTDAERANHTILVELPSDASDDSRDFANKIQATWNNGDCDRALAMFSSFGAVLDERDIAVIAVPVQPIIYTASHRGADVRIGNQDSVLHTELVVDPVTGHIWAAVLSQWGDGSDTKLYMSSNGGHTWEQQLLHATAWRTNDMDIAVYGDWLYFATTTEWDQDEAQIYRFLSASGDWVDFPSGEYTEVIYTTGSSEEILEIELESNVDLSSSSVGRLYCFLMESDGDIVMRWDGPDCGSFVTDQVITANAKSGLSFSVDGEYSSYIRYISYIDNDDTLRVHGMIGSNRPQLWKAYTGASYSKYTAISAWRDTIHVFFERKTTSIDKQVSYYVSYNGGDSWLLGSFSGDAELSECPAVDGRRDGGIGVFYRYYNSPRDMLFKWRDYGSYWTSPAAVTEHEPYYIPGAAAYMGQEKFGLIYTTWHNPVERGAYFTTVGGCCEGMRGNVNGDIEDKVDIVDMTWLVAYLFTGGDEPPCSDEADVSGDGLVNIVDMTYLTAYLFTGGTAPQQCPE